MFGQPLENPWNSPWESDGLPWGWICGNAIGPENSSLIGEKIQLSTTSFLNLLEADFPLFHRHHHRHHLFIYRGSSEEMSV